MHNTFFVRPVLLKALFATNTVYEINVLFFKPLGAEGEPFSRGPVADPVRVILCGIVISSYVDI